MPPGAGEPDRPRARAAPGRELAALREIRESARAWLAAGQVEATWEFFLSALEAVLLKNRDLELLVAQLRRARIEDLLPHRWPAPAGSPETARGP